MKPYYAFESVSMRIFDASEPPNSCHVILFFRIQLSHEASEIDLHMQPGEVDSYLWVPLYPHLESLLIPSEVEYKADVEGQLVEEDGTESRHHFDIEELRPPYPNRLLGGISKAHNFALRYLLKSKMLPKL